MAWSTTFEALMGDTITVATLDSFSTDGYGTPSYSTSPTSYTARVVSKQTLVNTFAGTEELAKTVVYVAATSTFGPADQITLPDGSTPELLAVELYPDKDGQHHAKLMFG
ncbi:MAG: hypothetical protein ACYTHJ_20875 [Planctomycetota bacterium]|jgi:hypothetical protein